MILTCAECQTRYMVPDGVLTPEGRRVRCSNCGQEWHQQGEGRRSSPPPPPPEPEDPPVTLLPDDDEIEIEAIPESVKPEPETRTAPVIAVAETEKPGSLRARLAGYAAAFALLALIGGGAFMMKDTLVRLWPPSLVLFDMAGVKTVIEGETLIFDGLKAVAVSEEGDPAVLTVEAKIINLSREDVEIPPIQISLLKPDATVADSWIVELVQSSLGGEGETVLQATYPDLPADVKEVNVRFVPGARVQKAVKEVALVKTEDKPEAVQEHQAPPAPPAEEPAPHH